MRASLARAAAEWRLQFIFAGRIADLRVPGSASPGRADGLWRHSCCELFVMTADGRYVEFNFAPSGRWAAYGFDGYRRGMSPAALPLEPVIHCQQSADTLEVAASLLPPMDLLAGAPLRIALCAMVEEAGGVLSCWAEHHVLDKPDFHDAGGFVPLAD